MKRRSAKISLLTAAALTAWMLTACGDGAAPAAEIPDAAQETEQAADAAADSDSKDTSQADAVSDEPLYIPEDRSGSVGVENGQVALVFEPNYEGAAQIEPVILEAGSVYSKDELPEVTRDGYRFAGWYDSYDPEIVDGVAQGEWLFGEKYLYTYFEVPEDEVTSMPIEESMTVYARWVKETPVGSAEELAAMKEDLAGWYVLTADIDLSGEIWEPVGRWLSDYEMANDNWWAEAFRGKLDGAGHTITGLTLGLDSGDHFGYTGLFGALNNAEVSDLTIEGYRMTIQADQGVNAAPLAAFAQGWGTKIENVTTDGKTDAMIATDADGVTFTSVTGLVGAGWAGTYSGCEITGDLSFEVTVKDGSEINIGGINGEGYALSEGCISHMNFKGSVRSRGEGESHTDLYIGGIQGGATQVRGCIADGSMDISMSRDNGMANLYAGGIVGQERYDNVENCLAMMEIHVSEADNVYYGGIIGAWNTGTYGSIGYFSGIQTYEINNCLAANTVSFESVRGEQHTGAAVSSVPEQLEIRFSEDMDSVMSIPGVQRISRIAALETGLPAEDAQAADGGAYGEDGVPAEDAPKAVHLCGSAEEMSGSALEEILGDGWQYTDGELPVPSR